MDRLELGFEALGTTPRGAKCDAMEGLIKEGAKMIDEEGACNKYLTNLAEATINPMATELAEDVR